MIFVTGAERPELATRRRLIPRTMLAGLPKRVIAALVAFALLIFTIGALFDLPGSARYAAIAGGVLTLVGALLFFVSSMLLERARVLAGSPVETPEPAARRSQKLFSYSVSGLVSFWRRLQLPEPR